MLVPLARAGDFATPARYPVGGNPAAVVIGDLNGDGKPDLIVANFSDGTVSVLLGNGDGTFGSTVNYPCGSSPVFLVLGDFNRDGKLDVAVANQTDSATVLLGNGDGTLRPGVTYPAGSKPAFITAADLNRDGKLDLIVVSGGAGVSVLLGNGDGTFQSARNYRAGSGPISAAVADLNGDGILDLVVGNYSSDDISVLFGVGDGSFMSPTTYSGGGAGLVYLADMNGDGKPDVVVARQSGGISVGSVRVYYGNGNGTFQNASALDTAIHTSIGTSNSGTNAIAFGDYDQDGQMDLAMVPNVLLMFGQGSGQFTSPLALTNVFATSIASADLNADGAADLVVADRANGLVLVLMNRCPRCTVVNSSAQTTTGSPEVTVRAQVRARSTSSTTTPTGSIHFYIDTNPIIGLLAHIVDLGSAPLVSGTATLITSSVALGGGFLFADYSGDSNFDANSAPPIDMFRTAAPAIVSATSTPNPSPVNVPFSVLIHVTGSFATPTGRVGLSTGGFATLDASGNATIVAPNNFFLTVPSVLNIAVSYSGDNIYASASTSFIQTVGTPTTLTLATSPNPSTFGQSVNFTATVRTSGGTPTGAIVILDGASTLATGTLGPSGVFTVTTTALTAGSHSITASYSGDSSFAPSSSNTITQSVQPSASPDFNLGAATGGSTSATLTAGQSAAYSLSLTPTAGFSGTVSLSCSGAPQGATCTPNPSSMSVSGTSAASFTVSVATTARSSNQPVMSARIGPAGKWFWPWAGSSVFASLWFAARRRRALALLRPLCFAAIAALLFLAGCGGGSQSPTPKQNVGTPAGTYTLVLSATSGSTTHTQSLTLNVN